MSYEKIKAASNNFFKNTFLSEDIPSDLRKCGLLDKKINNLQSISHGDYQCDFILINNKHENNSNTFEFTNKLKNVKNQNECFFGGDDIKKIIECLFNLYVTEIIKIEPFVHISSDKRELCRKLSIAMVDLYNKSNHISNLSETVLKLLKNVKYGSGYVKHSANETEYLFNILESIGYATNPILFIRLITLAISQKYLQTEVDNFDKEIEMYIDKLCVFKDIIKINK